MTDATTIIRRGAVMAEALHTAGNAQDFDTVVEIVSRLGFSDSTSPDWARRFNEACLAAGGVDFRRERLSREPKAQLTAFLRTSQGMVAAVRDGDEEAMLTALRAGPGRTPPGWLREFDRAMIAAGW